MWDINDKILTVQHESNWDTKADRKGYWKRRERRKAKHALRWVGLTGKTPVSDTGAGGSNPSPTAYGLIE